MDSTAQTVATRLGTSRTRVVRAARRLGVGRRTPGGHWRFSASDVTRLRKMLGQKPVGGPAGYTHAELRVLAALQRAPRGALSARAVARWTGTSPTSASKALSRLEDSGFVRRTVTTVAEGAAHNAAVWHLDHHNEQWPKLAPALAVIQLPESPPTPTSRVPRRLAHLFWNVDLDRLDVRRDGAFIARRIVSGDDLDALAWAARHLPRRAWETVVGQRGLDPRRRALAKNLSRYGRTA